MQPEQPGPFLRSVHEAKITRHCLKQEQEEQRQIDPRVTHPAIITGPRQIARLRQADKIGGVETVLLSEQGRRMPQVLIVCTANICRSPVAEGLLRHRLQGEGKEDWKVTSAGTWAQWARGAAQNSIQVMAEKGIDIRDHRARPVNEEMLVEADLVLCMEQGHAEALRAEFPAAAEKIYLLSEMVGRKYSISDPYGSPLPEYQRMAGELSDLIDRGYHRIVEIAEANADQ